MLTQHGNVLRALPVNTFVYQDYKIIFLSSSFGLWDGHTEGLQIISTNALIN